MGSNHGYPSFEKVRSLWRICSGAQLCTRHAYHSGPEAVRYGPDASSIGPVPARLWRGDNEPAQTCAPEANGFNDIDTSCITGANSLVKTFEIPRNELNMSGVVIDCPYDNFAFVARIPADGIYCTEKEPGGKLLTPSCKKPDAGFKEPNRCNDTALDTISCLDNLRTKFSRNLFIAHLNVNSLRYKFFEIYNGDGDCKGGGILVYIKDSLPHRLLNAHTGPTNGVEYMSFEICFKRRKWFLVYMYRPPKVSNKFAWDVLTKLADHFVCNSNLTVFFGDINYDMYKDNILHDLCDIYDLKNSVNGPTCFKGEIPTLLDVFLTNKPNSFCHSINIDTGISDFHNLTGVVSNVHAPQSNNRLITYRSMKILITKNSPETWATYLSIFVRSLMMLTILYGLSNIYFPLSLIFMLLWSSDSFAKVKCPISTHSYERWSTREICGGTNISMISGILPLGKTMCVIAIK